MLATHTNYARKNPMATKRVLRAIMKAADLCAAQPEWVARRIVEGGFTERYDFALQSLKEIPYARWRNYNAEDTIRYYALRLHEAGMIKSTPNKIITQATDWRFFNELKRELKG
jgi:NitT/TauT family transport system substrate-binding protein